MLSPLSEANARHGEAAMRTAQLPPAANVPAGFVLDASAMELCLADRKEQIDALLHARTADNTDRVAQDLKRTILTVHVPHTVEDEAESAFEKLGGLVLCTLSPIGEVANPLEPGILLAVNSKKSLLDALRMLYAEMYSAQNLRTEDEDRSASIVIQPFPIAQHCFRVIHTGNYTIVEASHGYSSWVGYGEPERFLFEGDALVKEERGTDKGILYDETHKMLLEKTRSVISKDDAQAVLAFCKPFLGAATLLVAKTKDGFCTVGCLGSIKARQ